MTSSPWNLVRSGRYQEALAAYSQRYAETREISNLANIGYVQLNLGNPVEACDCFAEVLKVSNDNDGTYLLLGTAQWLAGKKEAAVETWRSGLNTPYTDAAGGVQLPGILLYGAVRMGDRKVEQEVIRLLKKRWKPGRNAPWPAPLAGLHLEGQSAEQLSHSLSQHPILRARQLCQMHFHLGVAALRQAAEDAAIGHMQAAAADPAALIQVEYYLAHGELRSKP